MLKFTININIGRKSVKYTVLSGRHFFQDQYFGVLITKFYINFSFSEWCHFYLFFKVFYQLCYYSFPSVFLRFIPPLPCTPLPSSITSPLVHVPGLYIYVLWLLFPIPFLYQLLRILMHPNVYSSTFATAKCWKQPKCLSVDKWIKKLWSIYTTEYYAAERRNSYPLWQQGWNWRLLCWVK